MAYYGSNYPPPGYGGYNSGPPPPQYGGYGGGSAYNVNFGGMPSGAVPGFTVPANPQMFGGGPGYGGGPPMQAPASMQYNYAQQVMANASLMNMQMQMAKQMGILSDDEDDDREIRRRRRRRRRRRGRKFDDGDDDEDCEDDEEEKAAMEERAKKAEEKARQLQEKLESNDSLKEELRERFLSELMRRQEVSGTFEETQGVVFPFDEYDAEDPVAVWYNSERDTPADISGEPWDPLYDSEYLKYAMDGCGTNEQAIIDVVATRCNAQRNQILKEYKTAYGQDLIEDLTSELGGDFLETVLGLFESPARYDAWAIKHAIYDLIEDLQSELSGDFKSSIMACFETPSRYDAWNIKNAIYGLGTDEASLIEILMTRTNAQIREMVDEYNKITYSNQRDPESSIEQDIEDDTSGDFKKLLISACQGNRRLISRQKLEDAVEEVEVQGKWTGMFRVNYAKLCSQEKCHRMAEELYKAGEDKWGTDEATFNRIFSTQDYYTLRMVWDEYVKISQRDIINSVERETSGNLLRGLRAIAQNIKCRPMFFAERLYDSMKGLGTNDSTLIRIVVTRSEIDMVQIKHCFLEKYKQTLWNFIKHDTSGDYRKLLCSIVGKN